jgi:hypothetical protein
MELSRKILSKIELVEKTFCWRWGGATARKKKPYGKMWTGKRNRLVHRVAYEVFRDGGEIQGRQIHHTCMNKWCVNSWHMKAVSSAERIKEQGVWGRPRRTRMSPRLLAAKVVFNFNRAKTHCKGGHAFSSQNTYIKPSGERVCRACAKERAARYGERRNGSHRRESGYEF